MKTFFAAVGFLFLLCVVSSSRALAQQANVLPNGQSDQQLLKEIVSELKQLRSIIARTNVNQVRFQMAFEQYKSQQNRVDSMNRELDSLKNLLILNNPNRATSEEMLKNSEERLSETTDPRQRQSMERQIQMFKRNIEAMDQRDKRTKERQTTLEMQVPVEQSKLEQLNLEMERIKQDINSLLNQ